MGWFKKLMSWPFSEKEMFGEGPSIRTKIIEDPYKKKVMSPLSQYLQQRIGRGIPRYPGQLAPELSPEARTRYTEFLSMKPEEWFQENITRPTMEVWREEIAPVISEGWAGALRGSGRYRSLEEAGEEVAESLATQAGKMIPELYGRQLDLATRVWAIEDVKYQREYQDWLKSLPEYNPAIGQALSFLSSAEWRDILAATDPGRKGIFGDLLGAGANIASAFILASAMGGSDIRLKKNIRFLGKSVRGYNTYTWEWKDWAKLFVDDDPPVGVIAQEVLLVNPQAIVVGEDGFLRVNYQLLN